MPRWSLLAGLLQMVLTPLSAQWINYPTPGIPRTADGKPNLSAPTPRTADGKPDLSGIWSTPNGKYLANLAAAPTETAFNTALIPAVRPAA